MYLWQIGYANAFNLKLKDKWMNGYVYIEKKKENMQTSL